jgi:hypothetical protein
MNGGPAMMSGNPSMMGGPAMTGNSPVMNGPGMMAGPGMMMAAKPGKQAADVGTVGPTAVNSASHADRL